MTKEIEMKTIELMLVAAYILGWETGNGGYGLGHERVKLHWKNLREMIKEGDDLTNKLRKKS